MSQKYLNIIGITTIGVLIVTIIILVILLVTGYCDTFGLEQLHTLLSYRPIVEPIYKMPVYVINLERDTKRWKFMNDQLQNPDIAANVTFKRFAAFDGRTFISTNGQVYINSMAIEVDKQYQLSTPSELSCLISHLGAIRQAFLDGCEFCVVAEDDASFALVRYWPIPLPQLANCIGSDQPGIISLFHSHVFSSTEPVVRGIPDSGMVAYIVNRKAMQMVNETFFRSDHIVIPKINGVLIPTSDNLIYRFIPNSFMVNYMYVYPYNIDLISTIHDYHTQGHIQRAKRCILRTINRNSGGIA